jgi:hypothetical protein
MAIGLVLVACAQCCKFPGMSHLKTDWAIAEIFQWADKVDVVIVSRFRVLVHLLNIKHMVRKEGESS